MWGRHVEEACMLEGCMLGEGCILGEAYVLGGGMRAEE
jgi:hypothetical protein